MGTPSLSLGKLLGFSEMVSIFNHVASENVNYNLIFTARKKKCLSFVLSSVIAHFPPAYRYAGSHKKSIKKRTPN